jgi:hypothetical protein
MTVDDHLSTAFCFPINLGHPSSGLVDANTSISHYLIREAKARPHAIELGSSIDLFAGNKDWRSCPGSFSPRSLFPVLRNISVTELELSQ